MALDLFDRLTARLKSRPWYELPRLLAFGRLVEMRNDLREQNLHDTEEPPLQKAQVPPDLDPAIKQGRTPDGTWNDLQYRQMGAAGRRFGRNVALKHTSPDTPNLMVPNPRVVSRELMTRHEFQPVSFLNLLAGAWIQFMVHDWFVHRRSTTEAVEIPAAQGDDWPAPSIRVPKSVPEPAPSGSTRPPAYANLNTHWWDASQVYGCSHDMMRQLRTMIGGKLRIEPTGLLPIDPETGLSLTGFTDNWWIGLAMLHTLFVLEHNYLCDRLAHLNPKWTDDQLYAKAKLINSALMARIHTLEWTPAILPHPVIKVAMRTNWSGLVGEDLQDLLMFLDDRELAGGIVGSHADHHAAPYSLTEEFVAVYRMHPLMPDELTFSTLHTGAEIERRQFMEVAGKQTPAVTERITMQDLFYSFGISHPGAIRLHNYPRFLQSLRLENGEHLDLAAVDIFRDRERGVPRYNQFRRLLRKEPVKSFDELTDKPEWRQQLKQVYNNDLESVDLMSGLFAEPLPQGFGFSETAFRIFILMASRRLKSDRFFTDDFGPELYTEFGIEHLRRSSMLTVLARHYPQVAPALQGVENAFHPWTKVSPPA